MKAKPTILTILALTVFAALPVRAQHLSFTILAGNTNAIGTSNGVGTAALFNHPHGLAVDSSGNVYVADTGNSSIRLITPDGTVSTPALQTAGSAIPGIVVIGPPFPPAYVPFTIQSPQQMAMDLSNNLYIGDNINNVIYKLQPANSWTVTFAAGGPPNTAFQGSPNIAFNQPAGIAVDTKGNLFFADAYNQVIREVDTSNNVTILAGQLGVQVGSIDGAGTNAAFSFPYGLAIGQSNTIYETDLNYYAIRQINSGVVSNFCSQASFGAPHAIATDAAGNVYTVGALFGNPPQVVIQYTTQGATNIVGVLPTMGTISAIAVDANTNIYLADQQNSVIIKSAPYPHFFDNQAALGSGVFYLAFAQGTNSVPFGYYNLNFSFPVFYHYDLGFEKFTDANDGQNGGYLYDYSSSTWWYTSPQTFPYLYDFSLNTWLYYFPDTNSPGRYTSNPRYFFNFAQGQIITK